jgi:hypothetical protein
MLATKGQGDRRELRSVLLQTQGSPVFSVLQQGHLLLPSLARDRGCQYLNSCWRPSCLGQPHEGADAVGKKTAFSEGQATQRK